MKWKMKRLLGLFLSLALVLGLFPGMSLTAYADGGSIDAGNGESVTISSDQNCTNFYVFDGSTLTVNQGVTLTLNISNGNSFNLFDDSTLQLHGTLAGSVGSGAMWMDNTYINVYLSDGAKYTVTGLTCMDGDNYLRYYGYDAATDGNGTVSVTSGSTAVTASSIGYKTTTYTFTATPASGYKFKNWTKGAGGEVLGSDASINVTCEQNGQYQVYANFESDKTAQTITASDVTVTYGDTGKKIEASTNGDGTLSYAVKSGGAVTVDENTGALTIVKSGSAVITVTAAETATYAQATKDVNVTVNTKAMTVSAENVNVTVDGQPHGITVNVTDPASGATVKYGTEVGTYNLDASPTQTEAGELTVYYQVTADNYTTYTGSAKVTVNAKQTQTITASDVTATYGDMDKKISATTNGNGAISYAVKDGSTEYIDVNSSTGALTIKKVGTATVIVTAAETSTYTQATKEVTVTINKANAVAATVTANNRTYDGTEKPLVTVTGEATGGEMQYALGTATAATQPYTTSIPTATNAGIYYVWYKVVGNENYNDTKPVCLADIKIAKREVALEWSDTSMVYNGEPQLPTVAIKNKVEGDEVSAVLTGGSTDAGYFEATVAGLEGKDADNYAVPKNNSKVCSIAKAAPVISVSMPNRTYGDAATVPDVTGVPDGKTAIIEYKPIDANVYTTTAPVNAGKYKVRATLKGDNNYETVSAVYNFVIYPKEVTLTWGETEFIFNGKDQVPSVTVSGFVGTDELTADVAGAATAVGTHTATVLSLNGKAADNYKLPADTRKTFTIIKAELPDDEGDNPAKLTMPGWTYGDSAPDPVIENNIGGGTVNFSYAKDTVAEGGEDTLDYVNGKPSEAGSYIVKAEIGATENYEAAVRYARFVIRPREAVVEWGDTAFVYDGQKHKPSCEVTNLVNSDKCEVTVSVAGDTSAVGEYIATVSGLSNENYALSGTTSTVFTVSKDRPALSVSMTGWIYGDEANSPIVEGNTGNEQVTYTYYTDEELKEKTGADNGAATVGGIPSYAGNYYVEAVTEATASYEGGRAVAGFTIGKRNLDIGWMDISYTYDGRSHVPSVDALNKVTGDELILTVHGVAVDAGDYEASVEITGASVSNYNLPAITTQRFGISKRVAHFLYIP